ncbi:MAG: tetratricopeptide repeat protein [Deltaproteobacteria bacterium]|nr:tetratricopeptide repeat protein [Deltaproteobacteria bacterium]
MVEETNLAEVDARCGDANDALREANHGVQTFSAMGDADSNGYRAWALVGRAQAFARLGRFEEAHADLEVARGIYESQENPEPNEMGDL